MNIDYSQFYRGTTNIPSYGSGAYKKDTLVKYEFNTKDEHGNKVMDKMSREETLQAMKDIRSQYGDAVIVEFSGDGMAALVEGKKGSMVPEDKEAMEAKNAAFQKDIVQIDNSLNDLPAYSGMYGADKAVASALENCNKEEQGFVYDIIRQNFLVGNSGSILSGEYLARHEESRICGTELYPGGKQGGISGSDGVHCKIGKRRKSRQQREHGLWRCKSQVSWAWQRPCPDHKRAWHDAGDG